MTEIAIPKLALVVLVGPSGSGKSTFAARHFLPTEVLSSDRFRGWITDDETNQQATSEAFAVLHDLAARRLRWGRLTVVDATNTQPESRKSLVALARQAHVAAVAIVLRTPIAECVARNRTRPDRPFGESVVRRQADQLRRSFGKLRGEGFQQVVVLDDPVAIEQAAIVRRPLDCDRTDWTGPFDLIGDVHGCGDELEELLGQLGYVTSPTDPPDGGWAAPCYTHPAGRRAVFVGDLMDRGPRNLDVVRMVRAMVQRGTAACVVGNHDEKLLRWLEGRNVQVGQGLQTTVAEIEALDEAERPAFTNELRGFVNTLPSHLILDGGRLVVAHAGLPQNYHGRTSKKVRSFALYGQVSGERDEYGLPVRGNWAADYEGRARVVYGHTPVAEPAWFNRTVNIDTGCVFGGRLTALRYPELEFVSVPARRTYWESPRPFLAAASHAPPPSTATDDGSLDVGRVLGKQFLATRLHGSVRIDEESASAALEVMSRFADDPRWLIYLPPTMAPCDVSHRPEYLEHPDEAFAYFQRAGVETVVCEEKHMGSRAVLVVARDAEAAAQRFGVTDGTCGAVLSRTGRAFFSKPEDEAAILQRVQAALTASGLWEELNTTWVCLDCELLPWSAKARELLIQQYAAVGSAGRQALTAAQRMLDQAAARSDLSEPDELNSLRQRTHRRHEAIERFTTAYGHYCWPVESLDDLRLAPFHLLASEGQVHSGRPHTWHMQTLARLAEVDAGLFLATPYRTVALADSAGVAEAVHWWCELTERGGEGLVIKPEAFVVGQGSKLVQPAVKCRGREYLRIIYGPDYCEPENLARLRHRRPQRIQGLAKLEFALGIEALERFVAHEPLARVHECVFGILALETRPLDPRL